MTVTDELLQNADTYAASFDKGELPLPPAKGVAVAACMDARLNPHTDCGMLTFTDDGFKAQIEADTGIKPTWSAEAFTDLDADVRQSIARIKDESSIPVKTSIRGFVYEVETGKLREVL